MKLDWVLLREQKEYVNNEACNNQDARHIYEGLLSLIDAVQDEAVVNGDATEKEVFG